jgi:hypothetical protein
LRQLQHLLGLLALSDLENYRPPFLPIGGARALDLHHEGRRACPRQLYFAVLLGPARKDFVQEIAEGKTVALGNEQT